MHAARERGAQDRTGHDNEGTRSKCIQRTQIMRRERWRHAAYAHACCAVSRCVVGIKAGHPPSCTDGAAQCASMMCCTSASLACRFHPRGGASHSGHSGTRTSLALGLVHICMSCAKCAVQNGLWHPWHTSGRKSSRRQCAQGAPIHSIDPVLRIVHCCVVWQIQEGRVIPSSYHVARTRGDQAHRVGLVDL